MKKPPQKIGPWTVLTQRPVYDTPWIAVSHHDVLTPANTPGIYGTVHFRFRAVGILPLSSDGFTWLVGQHRFPLDLYSWEIPEGGGLFNEDPLVAAKRELLEETGLIAQSWEKVLDLHLSNSVTDEVAVAYLARDVSIAGPATPDLTEDLAVRRVPFDEVVSMVLDGRITDALSVATVLRVKLLLLGT